MFFYDKKIRYLNYYENGIRLQNAGYVKFEVRDDVCQMLICIKGPRLMGNGEARIWFLMNQKNGDADNKKILGTMVIRSGQGRLMLRISTEDMGGTGLTYHQLTGIRVELQRQQYLECRWEPEEKPAEERREPEVKPKIRHDFCAEDARETEKTERLHILDTEDMESSMETERRYVFDEENMWDKWKEIFPVIHSLDERECLKLTPKDLEILLEEECMLMHNSFLLHGFYNYRHLILWKEQTPQRMYFCLGIPGVFHERENVLARMFGFEYFCCQNKTPKAGSFGYYYRYVVIKSPQNQKQE